MIAFVNGQLIEEEKATLQIGDLALHRGYAVFDFMRTRHHVPLFIDEHIARFFNSAKLMHLHPPISREEVKTAVYSVMKENNLPESGIRMLLTGGYSPNYYEPAAPNLIILQQKLQMPAEENFKAGIKVLLHEYCRDLPEAKSTNYLRSIWLQPSLKAQGADDALYYQNDIISELPRSNIFMLTRDGKIATPARNILHGVTRRNLLSLLKDKYEAEERDITTSELKSAREIFITSTTMRILPVCRVDNTTIGNGKPGEVTRALYKAFAAMEDEWLEKHRADWLPGKGL